MIDSNNARLSPLDFIVVFIRYSPFLNPEFPFFCRGAAHATLLACWSVRRNDSLYQLNLYCTIRTALPDRLCARGNISERPYEFWRSSLPRDFVSENDAGHTALQFRKPS